MRLVDPNFIKLFKLAQLTIEYLLVSCYSLNPIVYTQHRWLARGHSAKKH